MERIRDIAREIVEFEGMEMVHLEMKTAGGTGFLRLYIERENGVTLDDCSRVSRRLSAQLDIEDPFDHPYTLEVSSPGLDRPLFSDRDYQRFAGEQVRIRTAAPRDGRRQFIGILAGLSGGEVRLVVDDHREISIPRDQIVEARLVPDAGGRKGRDGRKGQHA